MHTTESQFWITVLCNDTLSFSWRNHFKPKSRMLELLTLPPGRGARGGHGDGGGGGGDRILYLNLDYLHLYEILLLHRLLQMLQVVKVFVQLEPVVQVQKRCLPLSDDVFLQ